MPKNNKRQKGGRQVDGAISGSLGASKYFKKQIGLSDVDVMLDVVCRHKDFLPNFQHVMTTRKQMPFKNGELHFTLRGSTPSTDGKLPHSVSLPGAAGDARLKDSNIGKEITNQIVLLNEVLQENFEDSVDPVKPDSLAGLNTPLRKPVKLAKIFNRLPSDGTRFVASTGVTLTDGMTQLAAENNLEFTKDVLEAIESVSDALDDRGTGGASYSSVLLYREGVVTVWIICLGHDNSKSCERFLNITNAVKLLLVSE
jgi:hypothetical protein